VESKPLSSVIIGNHKLVGGFNPSEKNILYRQLGLLFPIYGKIKHVPNHQPGQPVN
jgi:hypothetical protein